MHKKPLITVLMAVFNGERYIQPTIESILNQIFADFEFVIINDASTDSTAEIIKSYKDARIILFNNATNIGQTKSLNIGLQLARGKYVARTDAGDVSLPMRLERQVTYIQSNPEVTVVSTSAFRYTDSWKVIDVVHMPNSKLAMIQRIFFASPIIHISVLMNRETILHLGGYDENYHIAADYELWSRLLIKNYLIENIREVLVGYMVSQESFSMKNIKGKSFIETSKIIQTNVEKFTDISISFEQASNIYKMFKLNMNGLSLDEIIDTEKLFIRILKNVNTSKSDIDYFLIKKYIKYVLIHMKEPINKLIFQYVIKSIFVKSFCLFSYLKFFNNLLRLSQSIFWKTKKNLFDFTR